MKKHDEGYALALVLVVLLVLGILVSIMLTFSLQHVQTQARYVDRMQHQYAAAGEIEAIIGQMQSPAGYSLPAENVLNADSTTGTLRLIAQPGTVQIDCIIQITGVVTELIDGRYTISNVTAVEYISYKINSTGGGA